MSEITYGLTPTEYRRTAEWIAKLAVDTTRPGSEVSPRAFGNFLEHLGNSIHGGISAQLLANPGFERNHNLSIDQRRHLMRTGRMLEKIFLEGPDSRAIPPRWTPSIGATGFGAAILDDCADEGVPLPWARLGGGGGVHASLGRIGGAVRLRTRAEPAGVRQAIFLPVHRTSDCTGDLWARIAVPDGKDVRGEIEVGIARRLGPTETLVERRIEIRGADWVRLDFELCVPSGSVAAGEPVDFFLRWLPGDPEHALLVDRARLFPADPVDGFDPEVIRVVREMNVPLLRWPGGNFVSHYHWRDGVGPMDDRPTRPNPAWGGLDYGEFGVAEFIRFCRRVGCEPHIAVNSGTGTPEEAAAWVEYCNGGADTAMGRLRALHGDPEPYGVRLWEVGNEIYGEWQGGYHGAEENGRRASEFARAMRAVDPTIEVIATGNGFDFVWRDARLEHAHTDGRWHRKLLECAGRDVDYISLHSLPGNDGVFEHVDDREAHYGLMAQPAVWERRYLPDLLKLIDSLAPGRPPIGVAMTEWGILGGDFRRPHVENYGGAVYAGLFLNLMLRGAERLPIANATGLLHGGCIRKLAGRVYVDPQVPVLHRYTALAGARPLPCRLEAPGYDVAEGPDLGGPIEDVPFVDAVASLAPNKCLVVTAVNVHLEREILLQVELPGGKLANPARVVVLTGSGVSAVASLADPRGCEIRDVPADAEGGAVRVSLPPCSVSWIELDLVP